VDDTSEGEPGVQALTVGSGATGDSEHAAARSEEGNHHRLFPHIPDGLPQGRLFQSGEDSGGRE
jgi:hypothetical protein